MNMSNTAEKIVKSDSYFDNAPIGNVQKKFLWFSAMAYFFDQMDLTTFSLVAPKLMTSPVWKMTMQQNGMINFVSFFGMFLGAVFAGWMSDKIGRKKGMLAMMVVFSLASIGNGLVNSYELFLLTRFITGFGVLGMVVNSMVYVSEMMPSATRGKYQALTLLFGSIGIPLSAVFGKIVIPMGEEGWRLIFVLGGLSIFLVPLGMVWLKESPRWLVSKGRHAEAEQILQQIIPGRKIAVADSVQDQRTIKWSSALKLLFNRIYFRRTLVLFILANGATVGSFIVSAFFPTIVKEYGYGIELVLTISIFTALAVPLSDLVASFVTDRGGRKIPIVVYAFCAAFFCILMVVFPTPLGLTINTFIRNIFAVGAVTMVWSYLAESYPTQIRTIAAGVIFGSARLTTAFSMLAVPPLFAMYGSSGVILASVVVYIIAALTVLSMGEKTSKVSLEELNVVGEKIIKGN
jgi:MFS transporter, putative metabolite:H+ symporter